MELRTRLVERGRSLTPSMVLLSAALGAVWCGSGVDAVAAAPTGIAVLPCSTTPATFGAGVSVVCEPARPDSPSGPTVTSHVATVSLAAGAGLGVISAHDRVYQYATGSDAPIAGQPVSEMLSSGASLAINGGFFDINLGSGAPYTGQACGGMVNAGRIIKTPPLGGTDPSQLIVTTNGKVSIGAVGYRGTVTDGADSIGLTSVNDLSDAGPQPGCPPLLQHGLSSGAGITLITSDMGPVSLPFTPPGTAPDKVRDYRIPHGVVVTGTLQDTTMTVTSVTLHPLLTDLPALTGDQVALVASAQQPATWLGVHARVGARLDVAGSLVIDGQPRTDIVTLLSGSAVLIHNGTVCPATGELPAGCGGRLPPAGGHAETMVGISRDGRTLQLIAVDDPAGKDGLDPGQDAPFLAAHGAWNGLLFDGGGSTTMAARTTPGTPAVLVNDTNTGEIEHPPGPGGQRYVANALTVFPGSAPTTSPAAPSTAPVTSSPTPTLTPELAATGADSATLTFASTTLVIVGAATVLVSHRRRPRHQQTGPPRSEL